MNSSEFIPPNLVAAGVGECLFAIWEDNWVTVRAQQLEPNAKNRHNKW